MNPIAADVTVLGLGILVARLVLGLLMAAHGAQKLFGWFGGHGIEATGGYFESMGFRPARQMAMLAGFTEVAGGLLMALGLLGPIGPAMVFAVMIVAGATHVRRGVFAANNGIEVPLLYATGALAIALTGPGAISLDALLGIQVWNPFLAVTALSVGALGALFNLVARQSPLNRTVNG